MTPPADPARSKHHGCPGAIICHGGWCSSRFPLRSRDVEELLCERGITVTHAAIRQGWLQCGQDDAHQLQRRRAQPGDTWLFDAVCVTMPGQRHDLWRTVEQDDPVLDILGPR